MSKVAVKNQSARSPKGSGRLYKRDKNGKEHPPSWPGPGDYWLAYTVPKAKGEKGKRIRQTLRDESGNTITDRTQAESARRRILAPYASKDRAQSLRAIKAELTDVEDERDRAADEATPALRIVDAWNEYLKSRNRPKRAGASTIAQYSGHWKRFTNWLATHHADVVFVRDITPEIAYAYATNLEESGLSPNRYNKHISFLRLIVRVLKKPARIVENPFLSIESEPLDTNSRRALTIAELITLIERAEGDLSLLILIGASTGMRLGDCATLGWGETDITTGIISRIPRKTRRTGKPVKLGITPLLREKLSLVGEDRRTGYILPAMAEQYLKDPTRLTNIVKALFLDCGIDVHAPGTGQQIKRLPDGSPERDPQNNRVLTVNTGKTAIVECGFHSLRHTWVSMHAQAGTPGAVVQASVGHASPAMTAHYASIDDDTARRVSLALPAFNVASACEKEPSREPLPEWARAILAKSTQEDWEEIRDELLRV